MDLLAYAQIGELSTVAEKNGIYVPRLRGYRLMEEQQPYTREEAIEFERSMVREVYERGCCSIPTFEPDSNLHEYSSRTRAIVRRHIAPDGEFRWDLVHGKKRRNMKFAVRKMRKAVSNEVAAWNRYAGKKGVLYIHARIGGPNWNRYDGPILAKQPWFLEKVDDSFDPTYCSIYAWAKEV